MVQPHAKIGPSVSLDSVSSPVDDIIVISNGSQSGNSMLNTDLPKTSGDKDNNKVGLRHIDPKDTCRPEKPVEKYPPLG